MLFRSVNPSVEAGADITLTGGCDCKLASYKGRDKLKRFDLDLVDGAFEPALIGMMIGATVFNDGVNDVGVGWPTALTCADEEPVVAFEFWSDHWNGDAQDPDYPWIHHVYPQTRWQIGQQAFQNDFAQNPVTGFTRQNLAWADPYGDEFGFDLSNGGSFYTPTAPPDADCAPAHVAPS